MPPTRGSRPVPDPTVQTDAAIDRAVLALRDYIDGQFAVRDERLRGIDVATDLRLTALNGVAPQVDDKIGRLADVTAERFSGIETQLRLRSEMRSHENELTKVALDAAFSASKEAVASALIAQKEAAARQDEANAKAIDKSERATAETIKTNQELGSSKTAALAKSIDEIKERITRIESAKVGATENRTGMYATIGIVATLFFLMVGIIGVALTNRPIPV